VVSVAIPTGNRRQVLDTPAGYKNSDLGVIPEDWNVQSLRQISPRQSVGLVINPSTYFDEFGSVPMLVGSNVEENSIDWEGARRITVDSNERLHASKIFSEDLVTVRVGKPGVTAVVPAEWSGSNCASMMIIRGDKSFSSRWLCYVMNSSIGRRQIESVQYGTAQKQFNISDAINFRYPVPPLPEQTAIAKVLSETDALIGTLETLIDKKCAIKQGATQELLSGRRRLPGFSSAWTPWTLGDLLTFKNGLNKGKSYFGYGTPIVNYMDVFESPRLFSASLTGRVSLSPSELRNFEVRQGDVFFTRTSETQDEIGMAAVMIDEPDQTAFSGFVLRGRPKTDRLDSNFAAYYLRSSAVRQQIVSKASYTTRALTNGRILSNVDITLPDKDEQAAIASILCDMDSEIAALERKLGKVQKFKQGMMRELLTGRVRLV
jgi:type I restriction enzyme, S subunit